MAKLVAKLIRIPCNCFEGRGVHWVDTIHDESDYWSCNKCGKMLAVRSPDGKKIYSVGHRLS